MSTLPRDLSSTQIRKGNQNARKAGLYSRLDPIEDHALADLAREAAQAGDLVLLRGVARAYQARGQRVTAAKLRALARQAERAAIASAAEDIMVTHRARSHARGESVRQH